ncbi:MAG TPA: hypothetical protein VHW70_15605, partial [Edaphobacter sp.]|nr:hypothetical protein [Edaphobacter sp.]
GCNTVEGAEKVPREIESVPQRLKPHYEQVTCGTDKSVPLSKMKFSTPSLIQIQSCVRRTGGVLEEGESQ